MEKTKKTILLLLLSFGLVFSGLLLGYMLGYDNGNMNMCHKLNGTIKNILGSNNNPECINHKIEKTCYSFQGDYCYDKLEPINTIGFLENETLYPLK